MVMIFAHCFTEYNYLNSHQNVQNQNQTEKLAKGEEIT